MIETEFQKTKIGKFPKEWIIDKLINFIKGKKNLIVAGPFGSNLKVEDYREQGIPIIRLQNIEYFRFVNQDIKYITSEKATELKYHSFKKGDIILAKLGDPVGKTCIVPDLLEHGIVTSDVVRIRVENGIFDKIFLMYFLNSYKVWKQLTKEVIGSTRPRVNLDQVRNLLIPCPSIEEQQKIALILSNIDELIIQTEKIIEQLQLLKKGLMQRLFTQGIGHTEFKETRLGKIPKEWEVKKIKNVSKVKRGASPRPISDQKYFSERGRGWIRISDITESDKFLRKTSQYLSELGVSKSVQVEPGDLIMSICATVGKPIILDMKACIHDGFILFKDLSEEVNIEYMYYYLQKNEYKWISLKQTGTQGNLNSSLVANIYFPLPSLEEQIKISKILSNIDEKIKNESNFQNMLKEIKKGLMQDLLTGKKRVKLES